VSYQRTQVDEKNFSWFKNNKSVNSLVSIKVAGGSIRGVFPCEIKFVYPISCLVGVNGSGKSTLLALAACAFHNEARDFTPISRENRFYYTFRDFFFFTPREQNLKNLTITNRILEDSGNKDKSYRQQPSGRWQDYSRRANRRVVFFGINRIVPPSENSSARANRDYMDPEHLAPEERKDLLEYLNKIFQRGYSNINVLKTRTVKKNYLFEVKKTGIEYSGLNMGAGESSVMYMLFQLIKAGKGSLLVIDEIELGLHQNAQRRFIEVLKDICQKYCIQIICSTHSEIILESLPPEARFLVESNRGHTSFTSDITPDFAFSKLSGDKRTELKVFVEDCFAKKFIENSLDAETRKRITIFPIGSHDTVLQQMAAQLREGNEKFIAFLDGDQSTKKDAKIKKIRGWIESADESFLGKRLQFLPGITPPEKHVIEAISQFTDSKLKDLSQQLGVPEVKEILKQALLVDAHSIFHKISIEVAKAQDSVVEFCLQCYKQSLPNDMDDIKRHIAGCLT
jgi:predicted ATPase